MEPTLIRHNTSLPNAVTGSGGPLIAEAPSTTSGRKGKLVKRVVVKKRVVKKNGRDGDDEGGDTSGQKTNSNNSGSADVSLPRIPGPGGKSVAAATAASAVSTTGRKRTASSSSLVGANINSLPPLKKNEQQKKLKELYEAQHGKQEPASSSSSVSPQARGHNNNNTHDKRGTSNDNNNTGKVPSTSSRRDTSSSTSSGQKQAMDAADNHQRKQQQHQQSSPHATSLSKPSGHPGKISFTASTNSNNNAGLGVASSGGGTKKASFTEDDDANKQLSRVNSVPSLGRRGSNVFGSGVGGSQQQLVSHEFPKQPKCRPDDLDFPVKQTLDKLFHSCSFQDSATTHVVFPVSKVERSLAKLWPGNVLTAEQIDECVEAIVSDRTISPFASGGLSSSLASMEQSTTINSSTLLLAGNINHNNSSSLNNTTASLGGTATITEKHRSLSNGGGGGSCGSSFQNSSSSAGELLEKRTSLGTIANAAIAAHTIREASITNTAGLLDSVIIHKEFVALIRLAAMYNNWLHMLPKSTHSKALTIEQYCLVMDQLRINEGAAKLYMELTANTSKDLSLARLCKYFCQTSERRKSVSGAMMAAAAMRAKARDAAANKGKDKEEKEERAAAALEAARAAPWQKQPNCDPVDLALPTTRIMKFMFDKLAMTGGEAFAQVRGEKGGATGSSSRSNPLPEDKCQLAAFGPDDHRLFFPLERIVTAIKMIWPNNTIPVDVIDDATEAVLEDRANHSAKTPISSSPASSAAADGAAGAPTAWGEASEAVCYATYPPNYVDHAELVKILRTITNLNNWRPVAPAQKALSIMEFATFAGDHLTFEPGTNKARLFLELTNNKGDVLLQSQLALYFAKKSRTLRFKKKEASGVEVEEEEGEL